MYALGYVGDGIVYGYHNKLYATKGKAEAALKVLINNNSKYEKYKVFEARFFDV